MVLFGEARERSCKETEGNGVPHSKHRKTGEKATVPAVEEKNSYLASLYKR
jgi:hypothetical protein